VNWLGKVGVGAFVLVSGGLAIGFSAYRGAMAETEQAWRRLLDSARAPAGRFDVADIADLPEIAQRYFRHAIAPGTPIYSGVELEMEGTFLLGDKSKFQTYQMSARQVLRPPEQFIWVPRLRSSGLTIAGSDALVGGEAWTRFFLMGLIPVANVRSSPDLVRSAQFRGAIEGALWLPSTMLPENGARWEQVGPNTARVTLGSFSPEIVLRLTLSENGAVREVVGQRWSNANPEQQFRLQPFGGTMSAEARFQGLTIPTAISAGNHYGTEAYLPFFQARITRARFFSGVALRWRWSPLRA
jgi:hypothetical protein